MSDKKPLVAILMGSASDAEVMSHAAKTLESFGVANTMRVMSAHRTPADVHELCSNARKNGIKVIIAGAGMAAHLAGAVAAATSLPVIGVPLSGGVMDGMDALLSTVQMPKGMPVATVAVGKAGAINAAVLAVQILVLSGDVELEKLEQFRANQAEGVRKSDRELGRA